MMDNNTLVFSIAALFVALVLGLVGLNLHKDHLMEEHIVQMVKEGQDPIAAACAVQNNYNTPVICNGYIAGRKD